MKEYLEQDEDILSYALFPPVAKKFFEYRKAQKYKIDPDMVNYEDKVHPI
jgi:oxaloacetate decarboxylase alpha subunit